MFVVFLKMYCESASEEIRYFLNHSAKLTPERCFVVFLKMYCENSLKQPAKWEVCSITSPLRQLSSVVCTCQKNNYRYSPP